MEIQHDDNLEFNKYLTDVFTRLPGMMASEAASLTPANWLAARSRNAGRAVA